MLNLKTYLAEEVVDITSQHKPVVIAPGRYQPMHLGHKLIIDKLIKLGKKLKAEPVVIVVDSKKYSEKNPLTGEQRIKYLKQMFPNVTFKIAHNPYDAIVGLAEPEDGGEKYVPVGGVTGSDRAKSYKDMVGRIFGEEVGNKYKADVVSRDPDSNEDVAGASGTKVRQAAVDKDVEKIRALTGLDGAQSKQLMAALRKGMGVK